MHDSDYGVIWGADHKYDDHSLHKWAWKHKVGKGHRVGLGHIRVDYDVGQAEVEPKVKFGKG